MNRAQTLKNLLPTYICDKFNPYSPKGVLRCGECKACKITATLDSLLATPTPGEAMYPHNPDHKVGTCGKCGKEARHNVPRLGEAGGFTHADGSPICVTAPGEAMEGGRAVCANCERVKSAHDVSEGMLCPNLKTFWHEKPVAPLDGETQAKTPT